MNQSQHQLPSLSIDDFAKFFQAVHGYEPYDWQSRLATKVDRTGWPQRLAVPTGGGKTTVLDIALFVLALQANRPPHDRTTPTRIFYVIDRRIVVDSANALAQSLASEISVDAVDPTVQSVAQRLQVLADQDGAARNRSTGQPIVATHVLRGGFFRTNDWAGSPTRPTIVTGTVDQIGSRLLFRGYGINPAARSLQAALVANDSLIVLDEAHISRPMVMTLRSVADYQHSDQQRLDEPVGVPLQFVEMSATLPPETGIKQVIPLEVDLVDTEPPAPFSFDEQAESSDEASLFWKRYMTSKPVRLEIAEKAKGKKWSEALADDLAQRVTTHLISRADSVAVVVNRVKTAKTLHDVLKSQHPDAEVCLMIGRMRSSDRDRLTKTLNQRLATSRGGAKGDRPIVVVATQCLEVGADLDFERMVCEAASLDALRQRFGRLNRSGDQPDRPDSLPFAGEVIIRVDQFVERSQLDEILSKPAPTNDPIYLDSLARTFDWLTEKSQPLDPSEQGSTPTRVVDFSGRVMDEQYKAVAPLDQIKLLSGDPDHAVLLPNHLRMFAQTGSNPSIYPDPDVGVFLHGRQPRRTDVQICWRSDLFRFKTQVVNNESVTQTVVLNELDMVSAVTECPPMPAECISVPIAAVKQFLAGEESMDDELADAPSIVGLNNPNGEAIPGRVGVLYRGSDDSILCDAPGSLRPGDTLVLPTCVGGWSLFGHLPDAPDDPAVKRIDLDDDEIVTKLLDVDVADEACLSSAWKIRLRLPSTLDKLGFDIASQLARPEATEDDLDSPQWRATWLRSKVTSWINANWLDAEAKNNRRSSVQGIGNAILALLPTIELVDGEEVVRQPDSKDQLRVEVRPSRTGLILIVSGRRNRDTILKLLRVDALEPHDLEMVETPRSTRQVSLAEHSARVSERAAVLASAVGLPAQITAAVTRGGWLHDIGKLDPRMQTLLAGLPSHLAWATRQPLAKSGRYGQTSAERRRDRERVGLPTGFRHEKTSVELCVAAAIENDPLTLYLIATHHGYARPWYPPTFDPSPPSVNLSLFADGQSIDEKSRHAASKIFVEVAERFWQIQERFGVWNAAWLETILRLADQQVSREESEVNQTQIVVPPATMPDVVQAEPSEAPRTHSIELLGIDGSNSLGFLAAMGMFSIVDQHHQMTVSKTNDFRPRLAWIPGAGTYVPQLTVSEKFGDETTLVDVLEDFIARDMEGPPRWLDQGYQGPEKDYAKAAGKITASDAVYRQVADVARRMHLADPLQSTASDWVAALGCEVSQKFRSKEREIDYSLLYFTKGSGHQRMLELARAVRNETERSQIHEALFETWQYRDLGRGLALRMDPAEDRAYALRWENPSNDPIMTVRAANALAFDGLLSFPVAMVGDRLLTTGFHKIGRGTFWFWPLWKYPLTLPVARSLLSLQILRPAPIRSSGKPAKTDAKRQAVTAMFDELGILQTYRTERVRNDKFFNFSPAAVVG